MTEQVIKLLYTSKGPSASIAEQLLQQFGDLKIHILRSGRNPLKSWLDLQIVGKVGLIESAIDWLRKQGVEGQVLSA